jgi:hypothetical protein
MKKRLSLFSLLFAFILCVAALVNPVFTAQAWFGAGSTPGWPAMITGLKGEMDLPTYKFSPDFYHIGDTITFNTRGFNSGSTPITSNYYLVIYRVIESPIGNNVTDGDPDAPGINENDLGTNRGTGNDVQTIETVIPLGAKTFAPGAWTSFSGTYTTTKTGYFQFDFMDVDPTATDPSGHMLTAGFIRVLAVTASPTPTPTPTPSVSPSPSPSTSPSPSASPTVTPTPTPTITPTPTPTPTVSPSPSPSPTTSPSPSPSSSPVTLSSSQATGGRSSGLNVNGPSCNNNTFTSTFTLLEGNGSGSNAQLVVFQYKGESKQATTGSDGKASVDFNYSGNDTVFGSATGFPSQSLSIVGASNCQSNGQVLGASTTSTTTNNTSVGGTTKKAGQVLGASTLADTGSNYELWFYGFAITLIFVGGSGVAFFTAQSKQE